MLLSQNENGSGPPLALQPEPFSIPKPETQHFLLPRKTKQYINIQLVRTWFQHCLKHHGSSCGKYLSLNFDGIIRLIDVVELKLVKTTLQEKFLALSYVWGDGTKPVLTRSTEKTLCQPGGVDIEHIPRTIGDATELTRQIGHRFLWVDSVCIIQDNDVDKQGQLPLMDTIYHAAEMVIVAVDSSNAQSGIKGTTNPRQRVHRPTVFIQGHVFTTLLSDLADRITNSVWNTRCWTFQEALLARRLLVCSDYQV
ncbi:heterokaryon incompatibility protein-domain-containing protein [Xylaria sp. FL0064]|nr:heterokaryon incompatibility protein-domain-containing protein [Xylaria sp. FL0064]